MDVPRFACGLVFMVSGIATFLLVFLPPTYCLQFASGLWLYVVIGAIVRMVWCGINELLGYGGGVESPAE